MKESILGKRDNQSKGKGIQRNLEDDVARMLSGRQKRSE
jgi:hypothetical protein